MKLFLKCKKKTPLIELLALFSVQPLSILYTFTLSFSLPFIPFFSLSLSPSSFCPFSRFSLLLFCQGPLLFLSYVSFVLFRSLFSTPASFFYTFLFFFLHFSPSPFLSLSFLSFPSALFSRYVLLLLYLATFLSLSIFLLFAFSPSFLSLSTSLFSCSPHAFPSLSLSFSLYVLPVQKLPSFLHVLLYQFRYFTLLPTVIASYFSSHCLLLISSFLPPSHLLHCQTSTSALL